MLDIYQELVLRLAKKYKISDIEVERMVDSQFKVLTQILNEKNNKVVQIKHLGKFVPIKSKRIDEEVKTDS